MDWYLYYCFLYIIVFLPFFLLYKLFKRKKRVFFIVVGIFICIGFLYAEYFSYFKEKKYLIKYHKILKKSTYIKGEFIKFIRFNYVNYPNSYIIARYSASIMKYLNNSKDKNINLRVFFKYSYCQYQKKYHLEAEVNGYYFSLYSYTRSRHPWEKTEKE